MSKSQEKINAIRLRKSGWSIGKISKHLSVSKSSVSLWCDGIILTSKQKDRIKWYVIKSGTKGRMLGAEMNRQKRLNSISQHKKIAKEIIGKMSQRDLLISGISLYWAEGAKTDRRFIFINSDPTMILVMVRFIIEVLKVKKEDIRFTIQINSIHKRRSEKVLDYWLKLLDVDFSQFTKTYYIHTNLKKRYINHDNYFGILRVQVLKGSQFQYRVLGLIDAIKYQYTPV